jgi:hypothetical protein
MGTVDVGGNWTTTTAPLWSNSTATDNSHNHTLYIDDYKSNYVASPQQWYVYNDSDQKIQKMVELIDGLWNMIKPYAGVERTKRMNKLIDEVKEENGFGMHYGNSAWEEKKEPVDDELDKLFEI